MTGKSEANSSGGVARRQGLTFNNKIDFTNIDMVIVRYSPGKCKGGAGIVDSIRNGVTFKANALASGLVSTLSNSCIIDCSAVTGQHYLSIGFQTTSGSTVYTESSCVESIQFINIE